MGRQSYPMADTGVTMGWLRKLFRPEPVIVREKVYSQTDQEALQEAFTEGYSLGLLAEKIRPHYWNPSEGEWWGGGCREQACAKGTELRAEAEEEFHRVRGY
jgi:hypothetical protein